MFKQEPYPSYPEDWENPENTVFREFYLKSSPDFAINKWIRRSKLPNANKVRKGWEY